MKINLEPQRGISDGTEKEHASTLQSAFRKRRRPYPSLFVGCVAIAISLAGQDISAGLQKAHHVCMWNEAVCQDGTLVSIGTVATDTDMSKLDTLHDVKELVFIVGINQVSAAKISDAGFMHIQNLHDLQTLQAISLPLLTDEALRGLSKLGQLREVRFESNRNFDDAGLAYLQHLEKLQTVTFYGAPITDRGIQYLRESADLQDLQLGQSLVTDEGAREIAQFQKLKMLDLQGTRVTDQGMPYLATLPRLEWLCLKNTSVTDEGILALRSISTLHDLYITSGTVHDQAITSLERFLPALRVHSQ